MSLKAVELQVALPRTQEISRIQDQLQQRTMHEQLMQLSDQTLHDQLQRQRTGDVNDTTKGLIKEKQEKQKREKKQETASKQNSTGSEGHSHGNDRSLMQDPLRGRHIDISL